MQRAGAAAARFDAQVLVLTGATLI